MSCLNLTEADYWDFVQSAAQALAHFDPSSRLEVCGSLARGELIPPYSDLDLLVIAAMGGGEHVRDLIPEIAAATGDLLTVFADPFSSSGSFMSIYSGPFKVDWIVAEDRPSGRRIIWRGSKPAPYDPEAHPWDWLWWLWTKVRRGNYSLGSEELPKLWQFLVLHGADPEAFPQFVPDPEQDDLQELVRATLEHLPAPTQAVAREIRNAIEQDSRR